MTPTIAEIAASLSEAQKEAMINGCCAAAPDNISCLCAFPERAVLWEIGLVERKGSTAIWCTPLGQQVRAYLIEGADRG